MIIGYARVSTLDQNLDAQTDALTRAGCSTIYQEKISATKERPQLKKALASLKKDDVIVVLKLDRLGRSVKDLIQIVELIKSKGAFFKTLDGIDTSNAYGTFVFHIFSALAEMELGLIRERTRRGLEAARLRGRVGGRPKGLSSKAERQALIVKSFYESGLSIAEICTQVNISKATTYKYLRHAGVEPNRESFKSAQTI
jgi:DNA invertase Pin-like site-specific DNA recombinase